MTELLQHTVSPEDIEAAKDLAGEAQSMSDVATLREMLADQNGGNVTITAEDGETIEVQSIGRERFEELGHEATRLAGENSAVHSESWHTEEK